MMDQSNPRQSEREREASIYLRGIGGENGERDWLTDSPQHSVRLMAGAAAAHLTQITDDGNEAVDDHRRRSLIVWLNVVFL